MKGFKLFAVALATLFTVFGLSSCMDDDGYSLGDVGYSIATVVPEGNSVHFRTDSGKKLWAVNINGAALDIVKEQRAQIFYTILSDSLNGFDHNIQIRDIDTLLTKSIAPNLGVEENLKVYGNDEVYITDMWVGDGYLNIFFKTYFGGYGYKPHYINIIPTEGGDYELEFRHNAFGNPQNVLGMGAAAYNLNTLPDTNGETVKLSIKVNTFDGEKIYSLEYNSDKSKQLQPKASTTRKERLSSYEVM